MSMKTYPVEDLVKTFEERENRANLEIATRGEHMDNAKTASPKLNLIAKRLKFVEANERELGDAMQLPEKFTFDDVSKKLDAMGVPADPNLGERVREPQKEQRNEGEHQPPRFHIPEHREHDDHEDQQHNRGDEGRTR